MVDIATWFRKNGKLRDFMFHQIKGPLRTLLPLMSEQLPVPTKENTTDQRSHILIEIRDEFYERTKNPNGKKYLMPIINFIILMRWDEPYKQWMDWWAMKLIERRDEWLPAGQNTPDILIWKQDWEKET